MTQSIIEFAERMAQAPARLEAAQVKMVAAAALLVATAERTEIGNVTHGTNRLRGVGVKGAAVGASYTIKGMSPPSALVKATGPWQFVEGDTKAHVIVPKKRRGGRAIAGPGFGPVASAQHPGTHGKHPWAKGVAASVPGVAAAADKILATTMLKAVRG